MTVPQSEGSVMACQEYLVRSSASEVGLLTKRRMPSLESKGLIIVI